MSTPEKLRVSVELGGRTVDAATAYFHRRGGSLSTTVQYLPEYLADAEAYALDPQLPLSAGGQTVRGLPGSFSDCAPDRWGKNLIEKRVRAEAQREGRPAPAVTEVDLLVGVADRTRQGALRFRLPDDPRFLHPDSSVPPVVELPRLLRASDRVTYGPSTSASGIEAIKELLDAGTGTLGGARPKASVLDGDRLLIAKFPKPNDSTDVMAWECTALDLAARAGIAVPAHRLVKVDDRTVLLLDRFDRVDGGRAGYVSAMTLTGGRDEDVSDYLDVAAGIADHGSAPGRDLTALWRRMVFSVAIHNTDDHLRNHGFLRGHGGWTISPAFDINPNPDTAEGRVTGISGARGIADEVDALVLCAPEFGLDQRQAGAVMREVFDATGDWRRVASENGVAAAEISAFEASFEGLRDEAARAAVILSRSPAPPSRGIQRRGKTSAKSNRGSFKAT